MNLVVHKASTRGHYDHGWLSTYHSFSFGEYYNPQRMRFGVLRVLNDDYVAPGMGFGTHPHDNMEIISIPLEGTLEHRDSLGNRVEIETGEIQVMSAGTGVQHSEFNKSQDFPVRFLQIWLFPDQKDVKPRYDIKKIKGDMNIFEQILSPYQDDEGVWIYQKAWFHLGHFTKAKTITHSLKDPENGLYAFVLEGPVRIQDQNLDRRDGLGLWDSTEIKIETTAGSKILLMEIPFKAF